MLSFELTWAFEFILSNTWWKAVKDSVGSMHELCFLICSESLSHWLNLALPQNNHKQPWIIFATWDSRGSLVIMAFCLVLCFFLGPARKKENRFNSTQQKNAIKNIIERTTHWNPHQTSWLIFEAPTSSGYLPSRRSLPVETPIPVQM